MIVNIIDDEIETDSYNEYLNDAMNYESLSSEKIVDRGKVKQPKIIKFDNFLFKLKIKKRINNLKKDKKNINSEKIELIMYNNNEYHRTHYS